MDSVPETCPIETVAGEKAVTKHAPANPTIRFTPLAPFPHREGGWEIGLESGKAASAMN
jgi:hypothetical protein